MGVVDVGTCCENDYHRWLVIQTGGENVTLAGSDHSFSLPIHDLNGSTKKPIRMEKIYVLHIKSEEDKLFIKIVEVDEI